MTNVICCSSKIHETVVYWEVFSAWVVLNLLLDHPLLLYIYPSLQVTNASVESDFFSSSAVVSFTSGVTTASAVLLLQNDDEPEGNETFIVNITGKIIAWASHCISGRVNEKVLSNKV